jgi:hypothetical protein
MKRLLFVSPEPHGSLSVDMDSPMACTTKCSEIFFHVASQLAARLNVMDLEIFGTSALLASPAIAFEHLLPEIPIRIAVQAQSAFP